MQDTKPYDAARELVACLHVSWQHILLLSTISLEAAGDGFGNPDQHGWYYSPDNFFQDVLGLCSLILWDLEGELATPAPRLNAQPSWC